MPVLAPIKPDYGRISPEFSYPRGVFKMTKKKKDTRTGYQNFYRTPTGYRFPKVPHVVRVDRGNYGGWYVRVGQHRDDTRTASFADSRYGGARRSYKAALAFRKESLTQVDFVEHRGYCFVEGTSGLGHFIAYRTNPKTGRRQSKCFAVIKHGGKRRAERAAKAWRAKKSPPR